MVEEKSDKKAKSLADMQMMPDWTEEEQEEQDKEAVAKLEKERKSIGKKMMKGVE
jgi:hypothetical protein